MIPVSLSLLVMIYLGIMMGFVLAAWLLNVFRKGRREKAAFRDVIRCTICAFEFQDGSRDMLPKCPRCGRLNERNPIKRI